MHHMGNSSWEEHIFLATYYSRFRETAFTDFRIRSLLEPISFLVRLRAQRTDRLPMFLKERTVRDVETLVGRICKVAQANSIYAKSQTFEQNCLVNCAANTLVLDVQQCRAATWRMYNTYLLDLALATGRNISSSLVELKF